MDTQPILEELKTLDLGQYLEPHHLKQLADIAYQVEWAAGTIIFKEGEMSESVYLIQEGQVAIEIYVPGKGRTVILTLGAGQLLGWSPLFGKKPVTATGRTITGTRALALNADQVRKLCEVDHAFGCAIAWRVAEVIALRLKATRLQLLDIFGPDS